MIEYLSIFNNGDMNMSFKIGNNKKFLKRYIKIWRKKIENHFKTGFNSDIIWGTTDIMIKTKTKNMAKN